MNGYDGSAVAGGVSACHRRQRKEQEKGPTLGPAANGPITSSALRRQMTLGLVGREDSGMWFPAPLERASGRTREQTWSRVRELRSATGHNYCLRHASSQISLYLAHFWKPAHRHQLLSPLRLPKVTILWMMRKGTAYPSIGSPRRLP